MPAPLLTCLPAAQAVPAAPAVQGELDVITDLITFVEQQQFLAVEGVHRAIPSVAERLRARSLRLAASRTALRGAGERVRAGLGALQAQAALDNRFLAELAQLRRRWKLRRHAAAGTRAGGLAGLRCCCCSRRWDLRAPHQLPVHSCYACLPPRVAIDDAGGMFYADISLPLRGAAAQGIAQEGAQCNIIQVGCGPAGCCNHCC